MPVTVQLRPAQMADMAWVLEVQNQPGTRAYSRNQQEITPEGHQDWYLDTMRSQTRFLYIIEADHRPVGFLRLDKTGESMAVVSIAISSAYRGFGYATAALKVLRRKVPKTTLLAEIHQNNEVSQRLFENEGYEFVMGRIGPFSLYRNAP